MLKKILIFELIWLSLIFPLHAKVSNFLEHLKLDIREMFREEYVPYFLMTMALPIALFPYDDDLNSSLLENELFNESTNTFLSWSLSSYSLGALSLGTFFYAKKTNKAKLALSMEACLEAWFLSQVFSFSTKIITNRERPDGSRFSFPSTHVTTAFSMATVMHQYYGLKAGIPLYSLAILSSISRLDSKKHWLSDIVAGAGIGIFIGLGTSRFHKKAERQWTLNPILSEEKTGILFIKQF